MADKALRVGASNDGVCGEAGLAGGQLVDCVHIVECIAEPYLGGISPAVVEWFCLPLQILAVHHARCAEMGL